MTTIESSNARFSRAISRMMVMGVRLKSKAARVAGWLATATSRRGLQPGGDQPLEKVRQQHVVEVMMADAEVSLVA